jgi:uncharacterized protein
MSESLLPQISEQDLERFCRRHRVAELALFGSRAQGTGQPGSDVDLLVSFQADTRVTFLTLARMQVELEDFLGRPVDLVPKDGLKPLIRDHVLASAQVLYAA